MSLWRASLESICLRTVELDTSYICVSVYFLNIATLRSEFPWAWASWEIRCFSYIFVLEFSFEDSSFTVNDNPASFLTLWKLCINITKKKTKTKNLLNYIEWILPHTKKEDGDDPSHGGSEPSLSTWWWSTEGLPQGSWKAEKGNEWKTYPAVHLLFSCDMSWASTCYVENHLIRSSSMGYNKQEWTCWHLCIRRANNKTPNKRSE